MGLWMTSGARSEEPASPVALMLRVRQGDDSAFAQLYDRYHVRLLNFFYGLTRDRDVSDDLCQETFFRIWRLRAKYAATGSFPAYLFTFARNIWLEHCREKLKRQRLGRPSAIEDHAGSLLESRRPQPDAAAGNAEIADRIFAALSELPEEQRMVFVLRNIEGLSLGDTATIMQCPVNTVRSRKLLAVQKLRAALRRVYGR